MTVRAKFRVQRIERTETTRKSGQKDDQGRDIYVPAELQTIILAPVYGNGNPNHENTKFWEASPSGEIKLGTINLEAAEQFHLGKECYVDFTFIE